MKTDMQLHKDVLAELTWDPRVAHKEIAVAAKGGVVTLSGSVPSFAEQIAAEQAVERVNGVKAVANDLTVSVPTAYFHSDAEIAHKVVDAFAWDIRVPDDKIKAAVSNGWVSLEGEVEWKFQRDAAAKAVRNLAGVCGVTNNIRILPRSVSPYDVSRSIKAALERRADCTAEHITVQTKGSVVTLTGSVPTFGDRRAIEGAAWSAPGVTDVHDELAVAF
jgi:osmotically-inducible protein OsmY